MRRILIILAAVILVLGIAVGAYFLFFASSAPHLTVGDVNPFDTTTSSATRQQSVAQVGVSVTGAGKLVGPNLVQITANPVSDGQAIFDTSASATGSSTASSTPDVKIRYIDRQSGNIYEYGALSRTLTRLSDKTLPGIQQASWVADGSLAFVRFLAKTGDQEVLDTYALPANGQGGYFLAQGLDQATVMGSSTLFTLSAGTDGAVGTAAGTDGSNARTIFSTPLTQLMITAAKSVYVATTKASASIPGYAFTLQGSMFAPIIGPYNGLTSQLSPSGTLLLYSYTDGSTWHMNVLNLADGTVTRLPIATLTEKCAWKADSSAVYCAVPTAFSGNIPDDWYQGAVSFSDRIWKIDLTSHLATLVLDPTMIKNGLDATDVAIDPNGSVLTFVNKKDLSLWAYSL